MEDFDDERGQGVCHGCHEDEEEPDVALPARLPLLYCLLRVSSASRTGNHRLCFLWIRLLRSSLLRKALSGRVLAVGVFGLNLEGGGDEAAGVEPQLPTKTKRR